MFSLALRSAVPRLCTRTFSISSIKQMPIQVGDELPDVTLYEGTPKDAVKIRDVFKGKKGILFAVPGAFTPGCSKTHLPGYVKDYEKFKAKGVEVIVCVSVNDPFVMAAWGADQKVDGKVRMLADVHREFTKAVDLELDASKNLGNIRSKRYSAVIDDNKVTHLNVEADGAGLTCSLSNNILDQL